MSSITTELPNAGLDAVMEGEIIPIKIVNGLTDASRNVRKRCIKKVHSIICESGSVNNQKNFRTFEKLLIEPLFHLISDSSELCRDLSLRLFVHFISHTSDDFTVLSCRLIRVLVTRVEGHKFPEESEEVRLQISRLMVAIFRRKSDFDCTTFDLVIKIATFLASDPFPEVKKEVSLLVCTFVKAYEHTSCNASFVGLVEQLVLNTRHQHSRVRGMAIRAVECIAVSISVTSIGLSLETVIRTLRALALDRAAAVRKQVVSSASKLHKIFYKTHGPQLLVLLLRGMADISNEIQLYSYELLSSLEKGTTPETGRVGPILPYPFEEAKISYVVTEKVTKSLDEITLIVGKELEIWNKEANLRGLSILYGAVLAAGCAFLTCVTNLAVTLSKKLKDDDTDVRTVACKICSFIGQILDTASSLALIKLLPIYRDSNEINSITSGQASTKSNGETVCHPIIRTDILFFIATCLNNISVTVAPEITPAILLVFARKEYVESCNDDIYASILVILESLFLQPKNIYLSSKMEFYALRILLQIEGSSTSKTIQMKAFELSKVISNVKGVGDLCNIYYYDLVKIVSGLSCDDIYNPDDETNYEVKIGNLAEEWTTLHPKCVLLKACITRLESKCINHADSILNIFIAILNPKINSELRIYMFALLHELFEMGHFGVVLEEKAGDIVQGILLPNLSWRVGRVASSIRKIALKCCESLIRDSQVCRGIMMNNCAEPLVVTFLTCLEDDENIIRSTCCNILRFVFTINSVLLTEDNTRKVALALAKRLDDSNNKIRISACMALSGLVQVYTNYKDSISVKYIVENLLIHLDDQSTDVRNAVFSCLCAIQDVSPAIVKPLVIKKVEQCRNPILLSKLL